MALPDAAVAPDAPGDAASKDASPAEEPTLRLGFEVVPDPANPNESEALDLVASTGLRLRVGTHAARFHCVATHDRLLSRTGSEENLRVRCDPAGALVSVRLLDDDAPGYPAGAGRRQLRVEVGDAPRAVDLALPAKVELDPVVRRAPPVDRCAKNGAGPTIDVVLARKARGQGKLRRSDLVVEVPALSFSATLLEGLDYSACDTWLTPARTRARLDCFEPWFDRRTLQWNFWQAEGALWVEARRMPYKASLDTGSSSPVGGIVLPCGAKLRVKRLDFAPPLPRARACYPRCSKKALACRKQCFETLASEDGELAGEALACTERCMAAFTQCQQGCD